MKAFEKWLKRFYKNHQGVHHFDPTCKMGWRAALEEVLKQVDQSNSDGSIVIWIEKELADETG